MCNSYQNPNKILNIDIILKLVCKGKEIQIVKTILKEKWEGSIYMIWRVILQVQ